ncbi:MAG: hypothetical protein CL480_11385 [Acidobacteria bacterium]|nr:hypothetical protein [Acidobacteriota bacterium]|tara:strand:- start:756 stop:2393 length:1638 start_codon:yes stop_codon:yes gene_type:complete
MAINFTTFWTVFGKFSFAGNTMQTAAATIEAEIEDAIQSMGGSNAIAKEKGRARVLPGLRSFQAAFAPAQSSCVVSAMIIDLIETIKADNQQPSDGIDDALAELIKQMNAASQSLDASSPGCTPSYGGSNVGTGKVLISTKRGDGLVNEHILAEHIECKITDSPISGLASLDVNGEVATPILNYDWPKGSGVSSSLTSHMSSSGSNLVTNGGIETADDDTTSPHVPQGWLAQTATLGTTLKITPVEVQTVIISSTPSAGHYILQWVDGDSNTQSTAPLAYNASQSDVQSALRALTGLGSITNVTTGTSPDFTHTITFTGVPSPGQLTSIDNTTSGSIAHATTTAGSAHVMQGARSLEFDSNGSETTTVLVPVVLDKASQYACSIWMKADVVPAAGVFTVDLVESVTGTVINDKQSTANSYTIDATAISNSAFTHQAGVFRTPLTIPDTVYLRIRISTAVSAGTSIFMDEVCLVPMDELYIGGLSASLFTGPLRWEVDDLITLPVTNDRAGALHEWANRIYGLRSKDLLIPSNSAGGETQADSLIS